MKQKTSRSTILLFSISLLLLCTAIGLFSNRQRVFAQVSSVLSAYPNWSYPAKEDFSAFQKGTELGCSVSAAGDVNQDDIADVIVGAQKYQINVYKEGAVFVYSGSYGGLSKTPIWVMGGGQQGSLYGCAVSNLGDVNGDQIDDVVVGACEYNQIVDGVTASRTGAAFVYYGPLNADKTTHDWSFVGEQAEARFGSALSSAGDFNGDGINDLVVGAKNYSEGEGLNKNGKVFLFYGSDSQGLSLTPDWQTAGLVSSSQFGSAVANAGDVNGDGLSDLIIGAPRATGIGEVFVYYNSASGLPDTPSLTLTNDQTEARFGNAVAGVGDVNLDGYDDVLVGAPSALNDLDEKVGCVYLYLGSSSGLVTQPAWKFCSDQPYSQFGVSIAAANDMDGDGRADFLVGMPYYSLSSENMGAVFLFFGGPFGVRGDYETIYGNKAETLFGAALSSAGDVYFDGKPDVLIGAPSYKVDEKQPIGRVMAYYAGEIEQSDLDNFSIFLPLLQTGQ